MSTACVPRSSCARGGMASENQLLFAETLAPNTTPQTVHEVRFERPCLVRAFRVVCEGEFPHSEISFEGRTAPTVLTLELFGCRHGAKAGLCTALLAEPHRRQNLTAPSAIYALGEAAASTPIDYLVIR